MDDPQALGNRKSEHIRINLEEDVLSGITTGLEKLHFLNQALPEFDLDDVDTSISLFGKKLSAPLLISSMTGGTQEAERINLHLAQTAQEKSIALGLGSQRAAIEDSGAIQVFSGTARCARNFVVCQSWRRTVELRLWHRPVPTCGGYGRGGWAFPALECSPGSTPA